MQELTSRLPTVGDTFILGRYEGVVTRTVHRRVQEVRLTPSVGLTQIDAG